MKNSPLIAGLPWVAECLLLTLHRVAQEMSLEPFEEIIGAVWCQAPNCAAASIVRVVFCDTEGFITRIL